jgi:toxin FitB
MLLDSNIIIYAAQPEHQRLRDFIAENVPSVSAVTYVEVLGYHQLTQVEQDLFSEFFKAAPILAVDTPVLEQAVKLRQAKKMTLGDALIAATALVHNLPLVTHNKEDFDWIPHLVVIDPLVE